VTTRSERRRRWPSRRARPHAVAAPPRTRSVEVSCPLMGGKGDRWYVALLRGVNVGGHHKLPMAELAAIVAAAGGRQVKTYIQSGNAVFQTRPSLAGDLTARIADGIEDRCGFRVPVVLRAIDELRAV